MRGVVVHYQGGFRRALENHDNNGQLSVRVVDPVPLQKEEAKLGCAARRPSTFIFEFNGKTIAISRNVTLTRGRRYPEVEHWFVLPEYELSIPLIKQISAVPA